MRLHYSDVGVGQTINVRLDELTETLYSSKRNVTRLLKNMEKEGYLSWQPGKGRGHASAIQFQRPLDEAVSLHFDQLLDWGKYKEAIRLLKRSGVPPTVRDRCYRLLMAELSIPGLSVDESLSTQLSDLKPAIVSTETGSWRIVRKEG
ncbi:sugar transport-related sRNA regulator-like protein [Desmospora activa DSM 45169]|uniref:Sugar transport-related sRNA regulator-like protein n=1 Tax=Desmospora activa DSM 45169 TaxID=1121389 RepID=A0A2T4Z1N7_9BACL|nr:sugar transport-related sRNA regulator-like protein [Desmospora activa DSM 45169]